MYHIAIVDDEPQLAADHQRLVEAWAAKGNIPIKVACFASAEQFLFHYDEQPYDILLLDVEMGAMDGVSLAKSIRQKNKEIQIAFITGYTDYILDGYEVEALHYLLKPVSLEKLAAVLDRALLRIGSNSQVLLIKHAEGTARIPLYEIRYLEVSGNYVTVHGNEAYSTKSTLGRFEKELDDLFLRVGRSLIINLRQVKKVAKDAAELMDGTVLLLPRGGGKAVNQAIIKLL